MSIHTSHSIDPLSGYTNTFSFHSAAQDSCILVLCCNIFFQLQNRDSSVSRTDKGNKAKGFYRTAMRRDFWLMLHFVLDVLSILVEISKKFQERAATMTDILSEIEIAASSLEKMKTR